LLEPAGHFLSKPLTRRLLRYSAFTANQIVIPDEAKTALKYVDAGATLYMLPACTFYNLQSTCTTLCSFNTMLYKSQIHDGPTLLVNTLYSSLLVEPPLLGSATYHQPQHGRTATVQHTAALASLNQQCSVLWCRGKDTLAVHSVVAIKTVTCQNT